MKKLLLILLLVIAGLNCQAQDDMIIPEREDTTTFELDTLNAISIDQLKFDTLEVWENIVIKEPYEVSVSLGLLLEYKQSCKKNKSTFKGFVKWLFDEYDKAKKEIKK